MNSVLAGVQTCKPPRCLCSPYGAYSQTSHLIGLFIYLNISAGDLEAIPVVLSEKALVKFEKLCNRKPFEPANLVSPDFVFCFSFFYISSFFKLHMRRLPENVCQGKQESCLR